MLNELAEKIAVINKANGWFDSERGFGDDIALIHSEVSEAYEEYRNNKQPNETYYIKGDKPEGIPSELVDIIVRVLDTAYRYGIDLDSMMDEKLKHNASRGNRHGGKKV